MPRGYCTAMHDWPITCVGDELSGVGVLSAIPSYLGHLFHFVLVSNRALWLSFSYTAPLVFFCNSLSRGVVDFLEGPRCLLKNVS